VGHYDRAAISEFLGNPLPLEPGNAVILQEKGGVRNLMMKMKYHAIYALPIDPIKSGPLEILSEF